MKLSRELEYRIRYDVEHDLFHAQNVFSDEYITPTFIEYVQELEKENAERKAEIENDRDLPAIAYMQGAEKQKRKDEDQLTKAKEIIKDFLLMAEVEHLKDRYETVDEAEQFLNSEVEK